jgi:hypothetical protein
LRSEDGHVQADSVQFLIDLGRQSQQINKPLTAAQMIDHSFAGRNFGEQIISNRKKKGQSFSLRQRSFPQQLLITLLITRLSVEQTSHQCQVSANRLNKWQNKPSYIEMFQRCGHSLIWDSLPVMTAKYSRLPLKSPSAR